MLVAFSQISTCAYFSFGLLEMSAQGLMSSSLGIEEETKLVQKQGIVTILSSDCERNRASSSSSLRRTLSADMSSKKWLSQNGFFSPMKKIASSQKLSETIIAAAAADSSSSSEAESSNEYEERKDLEAESIWSSIQKDKNKDSEQPGAFDIWSSIISQKTNEDASKSPLPPPYIHPLVKRSQSSLSEKSLEICTESLGSETGSDGFSSNPPSDTGEAEEDKEEEEPEKETLQAYHEAEEDFAVPKYNYSATSKKVVPRSFPPPLPSLTRQDGPSVHMRSRRDNGRLVLEVVSVPCQNNFCARRQDGRLLLTFNNHPNSEEFQDDDDDEQEEEDYDVDVEEMEEEFEEDHEEENEHEEDEDEEREEEEEIAQAPILSSGVRSVHSLGLPMNKPTGFVNRNPEWSEKLNEAVNFEDVKVVEKSTTVAKSLPPRPRVARLVPSAPAVASAAAASASFNAYEYFWKTKTTSHQQNNSPLNNSNSSKCAVSGAINQTPNEQQKLLVLRGKNGDYMVHNLKSCKESRRSFLFWEPHCIATS